MLKHCTAYESNTFLKRKLISRPGPFALQKACPVFGCRSVIKNVKRYLKSIHKIEETSEKMKELLSDTVTIDLCKSPKISHSVKDNENILNMDFGSHDSSDFSFKPDQTFQSKDRDGMESCQSNTSADSHDIIERSENDAHNRDESQKNEENEHSDSNERSDENESSDKSESNDKSQSSDQYNIKPLTKINAMTKMNAETKMSPLKKMNAVSKLKAVTKVNTVTNMKPLTQINSMTKFNNERSDESERSDEYETSDANKLNDEVQQSDENEHRNESERSDDRLICKNLKEGANADGNDANTEVQEIYDIQTKDFFTKIRQIQAIASRNTKGDLPAEVETYAQKMSRFLSNEEPGHSGDMFTSSTSSHGPRKMNVTDCACLCEGFGGLIEKRTSAVNAMNKVIETNPKAKYLVERYSLPTVQNRIKYEIRARKKTRDTFTK